MPFHHSLFDCMDILFPTWPFESLWCINWWLWRGNVSLNKFHYHFYRWEYGEKSEDPAKSIPYQLQRLFVQLQTSKKRAVETTDVTKSFGWDSSEGKIMYESTIWNKGLQIKTNLWPLYLDEHYQRRSLKCFKLHPCIYQLNIFRTKEILRKIWARFWY